MSRSRHHHHNPIDPSQDQDQAQLQAELQAQLQAELQAQDQKQDQDQDQKQDQDQDQKQDQGQGQWQSSANENVNGNANGNLNGNLNGNANGNLNGNANYNENVNTTDVKVDVEVDLDLDHLRSPDDNDFGDIDMKDVRFDNIFMADDDSSINYDPGDDVNFEDIFNDAFGEGDNNSAFAVNQIADLVDNDSLRDVTMDNSGDYTLTWTATGGTAVAGDGIGGGGGAGDGKHDGKHDGKYDRGGEDSAGWRIDAGDDIAASAAASAAAQLTSNAFSQEIVLGANLQQNAVDVSIVGGNTNYTSVGGDDAEA